MDSCPINRNYVCAGAVHAELFDSLREEKFDPLVDAYVSKTLTRAIGRLEEVAEAYLFGMKDFFVDHTIIHSRGGYFGGNGIG